MNNGRSFFNGAGLDDMPQQNSMGNSGMINNGFNDMSQQNPMNTFDNQGIMNNNPQPMDMPMMNNDMGMNSNNGFVDMSQAVNMNNQGMMNTGFGDMNNQGMMNSGFNDMSQQNPMNTFDSPSMMSTPHPMDMPTMTNDTGINHGFNPQSMDTPMMNQNMGMDNFGFSDMNNQNMMNNGFNDMSQQNPMNSFDNSGMMNNNPQPMDMPMMNQNMNMQQPMMNPGMGMPQQNIVQPTAGNAPKGKFNFAENKGGIIIAVVSVAAVVALALVLFVFHKSLKCSADIADTDFGMLFGDMSSYGIEMTMESKTEFWFGKPTSSVMSMVVDFSDFDEDKMGMDKDEVKESLIDSMGDDADVKEKGDKVIITMETDKDDLEDFDEEYDDLKDTMEDAGLTCK